MKLGPGEYNKHPIKDMDRLVKGTRMLELVMGETNGRKRSKPTRL